MNRKYRVIYDEGNAYPKGSIIESNTLIEDYLSLCGDWEDADTIGWLNSCLSNDKQDDAIEFISSAWLIKLAAI